MRSQSIGRSTVHVVQRMAPGGIETLVLDLIRDDDKTGRVFSLEGETRSLVSDWSSLARLEPRLEAFDRGQGLRPSLVHRLARRFRAVGAGSVVAHHLGPLIYGGAAARLAGIPGQLVYVEHDAWHYENSRARLLIRLCNWLLRPRFAAVSEALALNLAEILPGVKVDVVPPGVDTERFAPGDRDTARARIGLSPEWKVVGTAGRLVPVKAQHLLIDAVAAMDDGVHAVLVGDGPEHETLATRAADLGVAHRIHMLGHRDDLDRILPAFDVFCLSSRAEGLPRSVLEAQACDLPVVATDVGSLRDAVCPATGTIVPPDDAGALADAFRASFARPRRSGDARKFVEERFSFKATAERFSRLVEEAA